jgi:hypothetical protein
MNFADDFGGINWKILLSLTVAWVLVYLILMKVRIIMKNSKNFFFYNSYELHEKSYFILLHNSSFSVRTRTKKIKVSI